MNNLLFISYGAGLHEQEIVFSLLSACHWQNPTESLRLLVYTDRPETYKKLPVTIEVIPAEQWSDWAGPTRFNHRCKILALQHALKKYSGPTALLDGDTWFRKPPVTLFERIGSGRAVMHLCEGKLTEFGTARAQQMIDFLERERFVGLDGREFSITPASTIWNAGVVGIDPSDEVLLDEVLHLTDQFCAKSKLHILEQFAFSYVLERRVRLQEAADVVFHYWPPYLRDPFRQKLPEILSRTELFPLEKRSHECFARRPRPTLPRRMKVILKRCCQFAGLLRGRAKTNEW